MFKKVEHIGIAVKDLQAANALFSQLAELDLLKIEEVESEGVRTSFFQIGETKIEFLEATRDDSPISRFVEKNGEGIHHIAFEVEDVKAEMKRLKEGGFQLLSDTPKDGADNKQIVFLHPKSTSRVLIELCQDKG